MSTIQRALLSVSDKEGVVDFARGLHDLGVELLSTGGTARLIREADLPVKDVSEFTGFPEMLDGRVKTLHPKVHAGLLYVRGKEEHEAVMQEQGLESIDLVCVNLYPFEETVAQSNCTFEEAVENIDIGGPTMLRSAAKNMAAVTVVVDPADYGWILESIRTHDGDTLPEERQLLAGKVFTRVAAYNAAISAYLADQTSSEENAPKPFQIHIPHGESLRYGENPHQTAALYRESGVTEAAVADTEQLHGKEMSYNNYVDGDAALEAAKEHSGGPAATVIKHTNPCGCATGETLKEALEAAWNGDPISAFGSVIAVTTPVDLAAAEVLEGRFVEAVIAPDFEPEAQDFLTRKSKMIRLLKTRSPMTPPQPGQHVRQIGGGYLVQDRDAGHKEQWMVPTSALFPEDKQALAEFGIRVCKHVKSNAILLVREYQPGQYCVLGMGAGQPNRVDAVRKLALTKARENIELLFEREPYGESPSDFEHKVMSQCVLVSDAFFPFSDNIENAADAGIRYIVQPGGSKRDEEVISACDQYSIAMAFTGTRHFRH